ncbi:cadherin-87A-like, partial [Nilaparvata lugens]|uniref:cadherin-87A-like n=1 Tax=Nilaparvata lugens TaxID=108931 RepID=UPI00193E4EC3
QPSLTTQTATPDHVDSESPWNFAPGTPVSPDALLGWSPGECSSQQCLLTVITNRHRDKNATANVNISVLNVNDWDPRFRYPQYEFFVPEIPRERGEVREDEEGEAGLMVGKVEAADGDRGDFITLSLRGPAARMFTIDDSGQIRIKDLSALNSSTAHLVAVATDKEYLPDKLLYQ